MILTADVLIPLIQASLTPDLLHTFYERLRAETLKQHPTTGHCYTASEALFHLLGGKKSGLKAMCGVDTYSPMSHHWWLQDSDGTILDPTAEQYSSMGYQPPYECGKGMGFLTKKPSKRARILIARVKKKLKEQNGKHPSLQDRRNR